MNTSLGTSFYNTSVTVFVSNYKVGILPLSPLYFWPFTLPASSLCADSMFKDLSLLIFYSVCRQT